MYFSLIIFTGFGDNDFFARDPLETCFVVGYLFFNVVLQAYILGEPFCLPLPLHCGRPEATLQAHVLRGGAYSPWLLFSRLPSACLALAACRSLSHLSEE